MFNKATICLFGSSCLLLALSGQASADQIALKPDFSTIDDSKESDSPIMFLKEEEMSLVSLPAPPISEYLVKTNEIAVYNAETQKETIISNNQQQMNTDTVSVFEPFKGVLPSPSNLLAERVLGADGRVRVKNTKAYPWRSITKLIITFPDGKKSSCSGSIVDKFHVLTAGHCVYSRGHGGYAKVKVYPGQNGKYTPYYHANSARIRTYTQWTINRDPNHDWALITLDRNIGLFTGWMGIKTASNSSALYKQGMNISGYPADRLKGSQWNDYDKGHSATSNRHFYFMDTYAGQSGAPVWSGTGSKRYILSIHAYGDSAATPGITNGGTRINSDKYNNINKWRALDRAPVDKPDLIDDGQSYSGFSPTSVSAGKSFSVNSDVRNIGTAKSGGFYVSYYASVDVSISTSDYFLGKVWVASVSPFAKADANWSGKLPSGIPSGSYYVGWIIDSTRLKREFSEANNTAYKSTKKLTITGGSTTTSGGALISPSGTTNDNTPTYKWKAVPRATYYYLWVKDSKSTKIHKWYSASQVGCRSGKGTCSLTPSIKLANGNGSWKIRTWANNKYGSWSAVKRFKVSKGNTTGGGTTTGGALISPSGTIKDNTPTYKWKAVPKATYYYLWVKDSKSTKIHKWYSASQVGCRSGKGTCSITPSIKLANGNGSWKIRTWANNKYGSWSAAKRFKVSKGGTTGGGTTTGGALISPSGTIKDNTPTYKWKAVPKATYYYLWVKDSKSIKIRRWYSASQVGCRSGKGTCSLTPSIKLANGNGSWQVRTWENNKYGSWSAAKRFKVSKSGTTTGGGTTTTADGALISPSGTITNIRPTYKWKAVPKATYYYLWVNDSRGYKVRRWYSASQLGCRSGKGTCSITPRVALAKGSGKWKIRTWLNGRYGSWSSEKSFYKR